jgi:hypothetical protein
LSFFHFHRTQCSHSNCSRIQTGLTQSTCFQTSHVDQLIWLHWSFSVVSFGVSVGTLRAGSAGRASGLLPPRCWGGLLPRHVAKSCICLCAGKLVDCRLCPIGWFWFGQVGLQVWRQLGWRAGAGGVGTRTGLDHKGLTRHSHERTMLHK